jgi:hypothetical protein
MAYTSFRQTDSRTCTSYSVKGDCVTASDHNYCVEYLMANRRPVVFNGRIFNDERDVTEKVIQELSRYAHWDFTDIPALSFLGKKSF